MIKTCFYLFSVFISRFVMPAKAGIQNGEGWIPAFAGMTKKERTVIARSKATKQSSLNSCLDCFASLAMTGYRRALVSVLLLAACTPLDTATQEQKQLAVDMEAIGPQKQIAYFSCLLEQHHIWECRQSVWNQSIKPHVPPGTSVREYIRDYLNAAELRGATALLKQQGYPCGEAVWLNNVFWDTAQEISCSNGRAYRIERKKGKWVIG